MTVKTAFLKGFPPLLQKMDTPQRRAKSEGPAKDKMGWYKWGNVQAGRAPKPRMKIAANRDATFSCSSRASFLAFFLCAVACKPDTPPRAGWYASTVDMRSFECCRSFFSPLHSVGYSFASSHSSVTISNRWTDWQRGEWGSSWPLAIAVLQPSCIMNLGLRVPQLTFIDFNGLWYFTAQWINRTKCYNARGTAHDIKNTNWLDSVDQIKLMIVDNANLHNLHQDPKNATELFDINTDQRVRK